MKSVLISIQSKQCEKILNGNQTSVVRKIVPKYDAPFKCYIYCTTGKPYLYRIDDDNNFELANELRSKEDGYVKDYNVQNGKVLGEFVCNKVGLYITDLKIYDKPRELSEFMIPCRVSCANCKNPLYYERKCEEKGVKCITCSPTNWCYVEEL